MTPRAYLQMFWRALQCLYRDNGPRHGAAIAYYTLFALAPVLLVVVAVAGLLFGAEAVRGEIVGQISGLIGEDGGRAIQAILQRASEPREGIGATVVGALGLVLATTGAFLELQAALNKIWRVKPSTSSGVDVERLITRRLRSLGVVVSIGFLLMVSLAISAAVSAATTWFGDRMPGWPVLIMAINQVVGIGVSTALFTVLFRVLPDVDLGWRDVVIGALTTAILFAIGQRLIGLYLGRSAIASPFGAAGTIAIILVWVYYATQIVLLGAEFTYQHARSRRPPPEPMPGAVRDPLAAT
jgi:membrane protein